MMSPCTTILSVLPLLTLEGLGARGAHRFLAESQSSASRSTPHAPAHEERRVLEGCETNPGLSRSRWLIALTVSASSESSAHIPTQVSCMSVVYGVRSMGTHTSSRALIKIGTVGRSFLAHPTHSSAPHSSRSRTRAFFTQSSSPFRRPHPNNQDAFQRQQHHKLNFLSRRRPPVVDVAATRDKKGMFTTCTTLLVRNCVSASLYLSPHHAINRTKSRVLRRKGKKHRRAHQPVPLL
jgi:hypothetical protein